jgi:K+-sensing histidine kinase KdpD
MPQSSSITVGITGELTASGDMESIVSRLAKRFAVDFADGSGAAQAANFFADQRTLGANATENLDLNGVLVNALGAVIAFTKIKAIAIFAAAENTNDVVIGNAASNGWAALFNGSATATAVIKPGGCLVAAAPAAAGFAVTAGTADILKIGNTGGGSSVTYDIVIIGS